MSMTFPPLPDTTSLSPLKFLRKSVPRLRTEDIQAAFRTTRLDMSNFHLVHHRHVDGILASAKNSGTHWLKYMLSHAIANQYGVEPPEHSSGPAWDDIIGNPRVPPRYDHLPRITSTHTIPSRLITLPVARRMVTIPPVVVLVRDIREALISNYVKWQGLGHHGDATFAEFVRGDVSGKRYVADTWWYTRFHNHWGDIAAAFPSRVHIVRYEDLKRTPCETLGSVASHLGVPLSEASLNAGLKVGDRKTVRARLDPCGRGDIVRDAEKNTDTKFSPESTNILRHILSRHLKYDYGYDYF